MYEFFSNFQRLDGFEGNSYLAQNVSNSKIDFYLHFYLERSTNLSCDIDELNYAISHNFVLKKGTSITLNF